MSYFINDTNSIQHVKRWAIVQDTFDESDAKWIISFGMRVSVDRPTHTFDTMGGGRHTIAGKPRIEVVTTTDKQRNMLMLKYGASAILIQQEYVMPGSISSVNINEVRW
jgi:hypothetical protein